MLLLKRGYERFLSRRDSYGILVYDYDWKKDKIIRELLEKSRVIGSYDCRANRLWQYQRIIGTIFFTESETCIGLQLADFVAYAIFQCYEQKRWKDSTSCSHSSIKALLNQ